MKAIRFIIPAVIVFFSACQEEAAVEVTVTPCDYTISVQADKGDAGTKALDLVSGTPDYLKPYWTNTEKVKVYKGGTLLGTLNVKPDSGEKPSKATLSGTIATEGLAAGDELSLMIPREDWDYSGQTGTLACIEAEYDYAVASVTIAAVNDVNHTVTTTGSASFVNQQSIYRFGFRVSESYIDPKEFSISAAGGNLVQRLNWDGSAWTPVLGGISVTPASASGDHFYYVSLRNGTTAADSYGFVITGSDDALYLATKAIPAQVLETPGNFISAKNINAVQADFSPAGGSTDTAL